MEHQRLQSPDPRDTEERNRSPEEDVRNKGEKIPPQIRPDFRGSYRDKPEEEEEDEEEEEVFGDSDPEDTIERIVKVEEDDDWNIEEEIPPQNSPDPGDTIERCVGTEDEEEVFVRFKEEEIPLQITLGRIGGKRRSYSVEYKKQIVEDSLGKNLTAYCKEKMLDLRLVRKWRADYIHLSQQVDVGNAKKRKCGSGRHKLFPDLEELTCAWIADMRAKSLVVRRADIQAFALEMAPKLAISPDDFKASQHWLDNFLRRYHVSLRR